MSSVNLSKTSSAVTVGGATDSVTALVNMSDGTVSRNVTVTPSNSNVKATVDGNGVITITGLSAGTSTISVHPAAVSGTSLDQTISVTVTAAGVTLGDLGGGLNLGSLASITTTALPDATVGTPYSQQVSAINIDSTAVWSATGLPAGLNINSSTGIISGTPTAATPSAGANVTITVTTSSGQTDSNVFPMNVRAAG